MDHYGITAGVIGATEVYFRSARQTGRTTSLLNSLKDGDRIVTVNQRQAENLRRQLKLRGLAVTVVVLDVANPKPFEYGTPEGRTLLDHTWVEARYAHILEREASNIDELQKAMSGWQQAHEETRQRAIELAKWHR